MLNIVARFGISMKNESKFKMNKNKSMFGQVFFDKKFCVFFSLKYAVSMKNRKCHFNLKWFYWLSGSTEVDVTLWSESSFYLNFTVQTWAT